MNGFIYTLLLKIVEYISVLLFCTGVFYLVPEIAFLSEQERTISGVFWGTIWVYSLFCFLLMYIPFSFLIVAILDMSEVSRIKIGFMNSVVFCAYAAAMVAIFSLDEISLRSLGAILIVAIPVTLSGVIIGHLAKRQTLSA